MRWRRLLFLLRAGFSNNPRDPKSNAFSKCLLLFSLFIFLFSARHRATDIPPFCYHGMNRQEMLQSAPKDKEPFGVPGKSFGLNCKGRKSRIIWDYIAMWPWNTESSGNQEGKLTEERQATGFISPVGIAGALSQHSITSQIPPPLAEDSAQSFGALMWGIQRTSHLQTSFMGLLSSDI